MTESQLKPNANEREIQKLDNEYLTALKSNKEFSILKNIRNKLKGLKGGKKAEPNARKQATG